MEAHATLLGMGESGTTYVPRKCPFCGHAVVERKSKHGGFRYFRCTNTHDCGAMVNFTNTRIYEESALNKSAGKFNQELHRACWERREG